MSTTSKDYEFCCKCEEELDISQMIDLSLAQGNSYFCVFNKFPQLIYFVNSFNLPGIQNQSITISMPQFNTKFTSAGQGSTYSALSLNFNVQANYLNYFDIYAWLKKNEVTDNFEDQSTHASLIILNNQVPLIHVLFYDVVPTSLSDINFANNSTSTINATLGLEFSAFSVHYLDQNQDGKGIYRGSGLYIPAHF